jgi:hypothetical protein
MLNDVGYRGAGQTNVSRDFLGTFVAILSPQSAACLFGQCARLMRGRCTVRVRENEERTSAARAAPPAGSELPKNTAHFELARVLLALRKTQLAEECPDHGSTSVAGATCYLLKGSLLELDPE